MRGELEVWRKRGENRLYDLCVKAGVEDVLPISGAAKTGPTCLTQPQRALLLPLSNSISGGRMRNAHRAIRFRSFLYLLVASLVCFARTEVSAEELRAEKIPERSAPAALMGQLGMHAKTREYVCLLASVWNEPAQAGKESENAVLKLEPASSLLTVEKDYGCLPSKQVLRHYIVALAREENVFTQSHAILALGILGMEQDMDVLFEIATGEERLSFYQSVVAHRDARQ